MVFDTNTSSGVAIYKPEILGVCLRAAALLG
jgi:hypothetical protein